MLLDFRIFGLLGLASVISLYPFMMLYMMYYIIKTLYPMLSTYSSSHKTIIGLTIIVVLAYNFDFYKNKNEKSQEEYEKGKKIMLYEQYMICIGFLALCYKNKTLTNWKMVIGIIPLIILYGSNFRFL